MSKNLQNIKNTLVRMSDHILMIALNSKANLLTRNPKALVRGKDLLKIFSVNQSFRLMMEITIFKNQESKESDLIDYVR